MVLRGEVAPQSNPGNAELQEMDSSEKQPMNDHVLLERWLRNTRDVVWLQIEFLQLFAAYCTDEELVELGSIDAVQIRAVGNRMTRLVETTATIPIVRVLCLGRNAKHEHVPRVIRERFDVRRPLNEQTQFTGTWLPEMSIAVARFSGDEPIRGIIVHELTHVLLAFLTGRFPYPIAIEEGFARSSEYVFCPRANHDPRYGPDRGGRNNGYLIDSEHITARELILWNAPEHMRSVPHAFARVTRSAMWLNVFLDMLSKYRPVVGRILAELRAKNIRSAEGVLKWLQDVTGMDVDELERQFYLFCTLGVEPYVPAEE